MSIRVSGLGKRFDSFVAVEDVSFTVQDTELAAIVGPSGSGKSTLLRVIAGLETADHGNVYVDGKDISHIRAQKRNLGFVFQHYALFTHMTVLENIAFGLRVRRYNKRAACQKVAELIELVKLEGYAHHYPRQLSGGQRQRVALARALATEPRILLLDEPFSALDAKVRGNLAAWLQAVHSSSKMTTIFVTHDQSEAIEIAHKIIVLNRGRIEQIGTPQEIYEHPASKFVASFIGQTNILSAVVEQGDMLLSPGRYLLRRKVDNPDGGYVILVRPEDLRLHRPDQAIAGIHGRITGVHYRGSAYMLEIQNNHGLLHAQAAKETYARNTWQAGDAVGVTIDNYKVFELKEGHQAMRAQLCKLGYIE